MWKFFVCISFFSVVTSNDVGTNKEYLHSFLAKFSQENHGKIKETFPLLGNVTKNGQVAEINDYVDDLLEELNNFIMLQMLDPVEMPDIETDFQWRILFITYKGYLNLSKGWLQGLGTMQRNEDVTVWYEYPNIKFRLPIGYEMLMFDYKYNSKFMGVKRRGNVDGKTTDCRFIIELEINMITLKAKLTNFDLETIGTISLKFSGHFLTDIITNIFVYVTIPAVKPKLRRVIEGFVTEGLTDAIDFYNGVICNLLGNC